jgi:hypothetical protein
MVALTGIEPDGCRFSSVQLGLSSCVFSPVGIPRWSETPPRTADVTAQSQRGRGALRSGDGWRTQRGGGCRWPCMCLPRTALVHRTQTRTLTEPCGMSASQNGFQLTTKDIALLLVSFWRLSLPSFHSELRALLNSVQMVFTAKG